jgi:ABC-type uncharacterized transport system permease subunit
MTAITAPDAVTTAEPTTFWTAGRRAGAILVVIGVLAAIFWGALAAHGGDARFNWGESTSGTSLPVPSRPGTIVFALIAAVCGGLLLAGRSGRAKNWLIGAGIVAIVIAFLCWQVSGHIMPLGTTANVTVFAALPLILGALAGLIGERTGVINVAIEGQFLAGAFLGALVGTIAASAWLGLIAAAFGGVIIAALLAVLAIKYLVDQVVLGVVLNLLALGITSFLYTQLMQPNAASYNSPPKLPIWTVPGLSKIPIIGPALFKQNILVYLTVILVVTVHVGLFHTRWGLRTRAVGEHPTAADTVGIKVLATRYRNVIMAGIIAGLGGAYFTIGSTGDFSKNMTVGKGFIALAALIFGRWSPVGSTLAALLFGFATYLAGFLGAINSAIPSQFLGMLPYVVTILAVAGLVGRVRAPAADGKPYVKG